MDQEKETRQQAERSRELAQRIMRELTPAGVQVLGGSGSLEKALEKIGARMTQQAEGGALLVAEDPEWTELPAVQCDQVLLVCADSAVLSGCAQQLAQQGFARDFGWKTRGKAQQTALFRRSPAAQDPQEMMLDYERALDDLRERMLQAERTEAEQAAQLERLRSDLSLSRSHEQNLEKTLNSVVNSSFWKGTWPLRYLVSKCRSLAHTLPPLVFLGELRRVGISGVRAQARAKKEYAKLFPGKTMRADRFASAELLVKQAASQPAAPCISIVVPLYNTPQQFLVAAGNNKSYQKVAAEAFAKVTGSPIQMHTVLKGGEEEAAAFALLQSAPKAAPSSPSAEMAGKTPMPDYRPVSRDRIPEKDLKDPSLNEALKIMADCDIYEKTES